MTHLRELQWSYKTRCMLLTPVAARIIVAWVAETWCMLLTLWRRGINPSSKYFNMFYSQFYDKLLKVKRNLKTNLSNLFVWQSLFSIIKIYIHKTVHIFSIISSNVSWGKIPFPFSEIFHFHFHVIQCWSGMTVVEVGIFS